MLAQPLNVELLQALDSGPRSLRDLRDAIGSPPQSTMRLYSRELIGAGIIARDRPRTFPSPVTYETTPAGRALASAAESLQDWLEAAPGGPIKLGTMTAKHTVKALAEAWSTNIVRALVARPLSLTQLNRLIHNLSYPSLERRLTSMRSVGLIEPCEVEGRGNPYGPTTWLREAAVPIAIAARWERRHLAESTASIGRLDVEAAFLMAVPLMKLRRGLNGSCKMCVEISRGSNPDLAGVSISTRNGQVTSCSCRISGKADAWASGRPLQWLRRLNGEGEELELHGDAKLAIGLLDSLGAISA